MNSTGFPNPSKQLNQFMRDRSVGRYLSQQADQMGSLQQARVLVDSGRHSDARPILERITSNTGGHEARFLLGIACYRLRDFEAAREHFAAVLQSDPGHANAAYYLGLSLEAEGQAIEALAAFRIAQAIRPDFVQASAKAAQLARSSAPASAAPRMDGQRPAVQQSAQSRPGRRVRGLATVVRQRSEPGFKTY